MNIYDVSKKAGVSIATVSRVINGSPKVSEKTRERVLRIIEESGYTPNAFARGLGLNTMKTVGILCADSSDPYLAQAISYIEKGLRKNLYDALLCCTGYALQDKINSVNLLLSKRVDGIVLVGSHYIELEPDGNNYIKEAAQSVPVAIVNGALDAENVYSTVCDDFKAVRMMTGKFIENDRKKLVYIYNSTSYSGQKKLQGFKQALSDYDISLKEAHLMQMPSNSRSIPYVQEQLALIRSNGFLFDGIVTSDDVLAAVSLKYAKNHKIAVPEELFIAGFNNFQLTEYSDPEITSIDNSLEAICQHTVATLMGVFAGKDIPQTTVFSPKIVERQTTVFR